MTIVSKIHGYTHQVDSDVAVTADGPCPNILVIILLHVMHANYIIVIMLLQLLDQLHRNSVLCIVSLP